MPDAGLSTLTELADSTRNICRAVSIPVLVDIDTGFGNALNVRRSVEEMIRAGAAGLFLEDQLAPKRCGWVKGKELVGIEEAVGKYRAACDVRNDLDPNFIIMARTDARTAIGGGFDEVARRGRAYLDAGVDVLYIEALQEQRRGAGSSKNFSVLPDDNFDPAAAHGFGNERISYLYRMAAHRQGRLGRDV